MFLVQFIHCSDLHLGRYFNYGDNQAQRKRKQDIKNSFTYIVDYALQEKPELFLITGDIFDRPSVTPSLLNFFLNQIKKLEDKNITPIIIGGNHDIHKTTGVINAIDLLKTIGTGIIFNETSNVQSKKFKFGQTELIVFGKSYDHFSKDILLPSTLENQLRSKIGLGLFHSDIYDKPGFIDIRSFDQDQTISLEGNKNILQDVKYLALGHYHTKFEKEYYDTLICNPGSIERLTFADENKTPGFFLGEIGSHSTNVDFISLKTRKMVTKNINLDNSIIDVKKQITEFLVEYQDPELIFQLVITGSVTDRQFQDLYIRKLLEATRNMFFYLKIDKSNIEVEGLGKVFLRNIDTPIEAFQKRLFKKTSQASTDIDKKYYEDIKKIGEKYLRREI